MKSFLQCLPIICLMLTTGCGLDGPVPSERKHEETAVNRPPEAAASTAPVVERKHSERAHGRTGDEKLASGQAPGTVREKAAVGMGEKGRGYGGDNVITVPLRAYWNVKEQLAIDLMKHAVDLFKASEGRLPKTQDEFMEKIIKANDIRLPQLPEGQRYVYDPNCEDYLEVERPKF